MEFLFEPEIVHLEGNALAPAKAVSYKKGTDGKLLEVIKPRTHQFEKDLNQKMKQELKGIGIFPTQEYVFLSITHALHSSEEYKKLDLDNRAKSIMDALKGAVYIDDSQVKILLTDKVFLKNSSESYFILKVKILNLGTEEALRKYLSI